MCGNVRFNGGRLLAASLYNGVVLQPQSDVSQAGRGSRRNSLTDISVSVSAKSTGVAFRRAKATITTLDTRHLQEKRTRPLAHQYCAPLKPRTFLSFCSLDARCFPPHISYTRAELAIFRAASAQHRQRSPKPAARLQGSASWTGSLSPAARSDTSLPSMWHRSCAAGPWATADAGWARRALPAMGCLAITLEVAANNSGAQAFYAHLGYSRRDGFPDTTQMGRMDW